MKHFESDLITKHADSGGSGSDAYPGQTPQAEEEFNFRDMHSPVIDDLNLSMEEPVEKELYFVFANGEFKVSPVEDHQQIAQNAGIQPDYQGPMAVGHINLQGKDALWSVESNIGLQGLVKRMKDFSKAQNWDWGGLVDSTGNPIHDDFITKKSYWYGWRDGELKLSRNPFWDADNKIEVKARVAHFDRPPNPFALDGLEEWAKDFGYRLADNDAIIDEWQLTSNTRPRRDPNIGIGRTFSSSADISPNKNKLSERSTISLIATRLSMAIDPAWMTSYLERDPYLYHETASPFLDDIRQHGLDPAQGVSQWDHPTLQPRPGHVYLQTGDRLRESTPRFADSLIFRVHHKSLDPNLLNPDEDVLRWNPRQFNLVPYNERKNQNESGGEWANRENATDPEMSQHSMEQGVIAHKGVIPPQHLEVQKDGNWEPLIPRTSHRVAEYPGGGDMNDKIKNKEWIQQYDKGDPEADPGKAFDGEPQGELTCPYCNETLPDFKAYQMHTKEHQDPEMQPIDDGHFPTIRPLDEPLGFGTQSVPTAIPVIGAVIPIAVTKQPDSWDFVTENGEGAHWHFEAAGGQEGKDLLQAPVPFLYDIERDFITVGHPGMNPHDVPGAWTPGLVEGTYEPGGKMVVRTTTTIPWSSYHMMQLWYFSHPGLEITSLEIENQEGETHKVASTDVGSFIKSMVSADGAAYMASKALKEAGGKVYVVGGAIRDALLQKEPKDIDLMVSGIPPEDVQMILDHLPGGVNLTGKRFGVYRYYTKGQEVEVALPRTDTYETGGTRGQGQITVDHHLPIEKDLQRRDFTANSMAVDLDTGRLVDPYGGAADLETHTLHTTHPDSFDEDPTRLVRALTMHSKHGLVPDEQTRKEMEEHAYRLDQESPDTLGQQLEKLLVSPNPAGAIRLAHETGVLKHLFPELSNGFDFDQANQHHHFSLGEHSLNVLDKISQKTQDPDLRLAALLHDAGKPSSAWTDPNTGQQHFYAGIVNGIPIGMDHAKVGADLAEARLRETYNYPVAKIRNIHNLISGHMFPAYSSPKGARKFLNRYGDAADDLLTLREADTAGKGTDTSYKTSTDRMRELVEQSRQAGAPTNQSMISVTGADLLALGVSQGPQIGAILRKLTNDVVENPQLNEKSALMQRAQEYINATPD